MHYVGDRFERFCSDADWAGGTVEKHRVRFLVMVSVFEGVDENRTRFIKHLYSETGSSFLKSHSSSVTWGGYWSCLEAFKSIFFCMYTSRISKTLSFLCPRRLRRHHFLIRFDFLCLNGSFLPAKFVSYTTSRLRVKQNNAKMAQKLTATRFMTQPAGSRLE